MTLTYQCPHCESPNAFIEKKVLRDTECPFCGESHKMPLPSLIYGASGGSSTSTGAIAEQPSQAETESYEPTPQTITKPIPLAPNKAVKIFKPVLIAVCLLFGIVGIPLAKNLASSADRPAPKLQVSAESLVNQIVRLANLRVSYKLESSSLRNVRNSYHNQNNKLPSDDKISKELKSVLLATDLKLTAREKELEGARQKAREQLSVLASSVTEGIADDVFVEIEKLVDLSTGRADLESAEFYKHLQTFFQQSNQRDPELVIEAFLDVHFSNS